MLDRLPADSLNLRVDLAQVGVSMVVEPGGELLDPPAPVHGLGTEDADEEQGDAIRQGQHSLQQLQRREIGPMQVLQDDDERGEACRTLDHGLHGQERARFQPLGAGPLELVLVVFLQRNRQYAREAEVRVVTDVSAQRVHPASQPLANRGGGFVRV